MISELNDAITFTAWLRDRWQQPSTIAITLLLILLTGVSVSFQYDFLGLTDKITWQELAATLSVMVFLAGSWFWSTRLPQTPADRIGILVAIDCETKKERQRLKEDFVKALRDEVNKGNHQKFIIHELSEYRSRQICSHEHATPLLKRTGSHLMVYGRCKVHTHQGHPTYVLELNAGVRHAPISQEVSREFSRDIDLVFPRKALIPENEELRGFELARDLVGVASRFILGIANLISGNPISAFDLHYGVWTELKSKEELGYGWPGHKKLPSRVASILVLDGLNAANLRFTKKPLSYLADMQRYLDVVQEIDPNHYGGHLLRGIYIFLSSRDIDGAKKEIKRAKNTRDAAWLWSSAFLDAYDGKLEDAHKTYQRAFRGVVQDDIPLQVETFIVDVLNLEPDKIQLWYCLGMINYFYKEDLPSARKDFQSFLEHPEQAYKFPRSVDFAKRYVEEIEMKLRDLTGHD